MAEEDRLHQPEEGRANARNPRRAAASAHARHAQPDNRGERESRGEDTEAMTEGRPEDLSDDERFMSFVDSQNQSVLPDLPRMPGFHVCWLTTSNPRDSVPMRMRWGYELIRPDMCPGWEKTNIRTGDYGTCIMINEMVAARIPTALYQRMMRHLHHDLPLSEEEKLKTSVEAMKENAASAGARLDEGEGMAGIVQRAAVPAFAV